MFIQNAIFGVGKSHRENLPVLMPIPILLLGYNSPMVSCSFPLYFNSLTMFLQEEKRGRKKYNAGKVFYMF
jgi:hypothetical protein